MVFYQEIGFGAVPLAEGRFVHRGQHVIEHALLDEITSTLFGLPTR